MKKNLIYLKKEKVENLSISKKEILRYMGCKDQSRAIDILTDEFTDTILKSINPAGCYGRFDLCISNNEIVISDLKITSSSLSKNLAGCKEAIVFAATLGYEFEHLMQKYSRISPSKALYASSVGTAAIESFADILCRDFSNEPEYKSLFLYPRFSPGYGDFNIEYQKNILNLVNAGRLCAISLSESYMMIPSKSVTAIIGVNDENINCIKENCKNCNIENCIYKR